MKLQIVPGHGTMELAGAGKAGQVLETGIQIGVETKREHGGSPGVDHTKEHGRYKMHHDASRLSHALHAHVA